MAALFAVGTSCFGLSHQRNPLTDMAAVTKVIVAALLLCAAMAALFAVGTMDTDISTAVNDRILNMVENYPSLRRLEDRETYQCLPTDDDRFRRGGKKCARAVDATKCDAGGKKPYCCKFCGCVQSYLACM